MSWWNEYIGLPFAEKGRDRAGLDCWGLLRLVYAEQFQIDLPSYDEFYQTTNDREEVSKAIFEQRQERWRKVEKPQPGDAILLALRGVPMHVGIVTKPGHMLHCAHGIDTVHERYEGMRWKDKVRGFYRYE